MIYIFTAIYPEAKALLRLLDLKKESDNGKYQQYLNDKKQIRLIIMGTGNIAAAICISHICTKYHVSNRDRIIHIGTCGIFSTNNLTSIDNPHLMDNSHSTNNIGLTDHSQKKVYICNKITQLETGKTFYPDILYQHDFLEGEIFTSPVLYRKDAYIENHFLKKIDCFNGNHFNYSTTSKNILIDMEAAGVYQAAIQYVGTEHIIILKVVSDEGEPQKVTPEFIYNLFMENGEEMIQFFNMLCSQQQMEEEWSKFFSFTQTDWIEKVCSDMHCSETMRNKVKHLFYYMDITGIDYHKKIEQMYLDKRLPCNDKREGKKCYEQLEMELL